MSFFYSFPEAVIGIVDRLLSTLGDVFPGAAQFIAEQPILSLVTGVAVVFASYALMSSVVWIIRTVLRRLLPEAGSPLEFDLQRIPLDKISSSPYQPRSNIDEEKLRELETSIRQFGIITPIQVTAHGSGRYQLVAGHRRVKAARNLGMSTIPALIKDYTEEELMEVGFLENLQREDMGMVDTAKMYQRLRSEFKRLSPEDLAEVVGKPVEEIVDNEWILSLPKITQQALNSGLITRNLARAMSTLDEEHHREIIRYVVQEEPTENELKAKLASYGGEASSPEDFETPLYDTESLLEGNSSSKRASPSSVSNQER